MREHRARKGDPADLPIISDNPIVGALKQQRADLRIQLATLGRRYGERHPQIVDLTATLTATESELQRVVDAITQAAVAEYVSAARQVKEAEQEVQNRTQEALNVQSRYPHRA